MLGWVFGAAHRDLKTMTEQSAATAEPARPDISGDPRWMRILARDGRADGRLWYSVSTTGIYCRPSCPSRRPLAKNVRFHDTLESARETGFRPCKRCRPDGPFTNEPGSAS